MPAPNNGSPHTLELKQTLAELKQGLAEAIATKASVETVTKMQTQLDALDLKLAGNHSNSGPFPKSLADELKEDESVQRILHDKKGRCYLDLDAHQASSILGRKTIISNITSGSAGSDTLNPVGSSISGVLTIDRTPGIVAEARQALKIRDVLSSRPTAMQMVDFVKVTNPLAIASPVPEASVKAENSLTFASVSEKVRTLATWIPATRQVLDDFSELLSFLETGLGYYVDLAEELELLAGDGTGEHLHGLLGQAASFNSALLPSIAMGWTRLDVVGAAIQQINAAKEIDPTFIVMNVNDWWRVRLTKDGFGRYILGDPQTQVRPNIFGLDVVPTTSILQGTFLVGSGSPAAAEIRDRMGLQVEISTEHSDYFTRNLVAIRAEKRLVLVTKRPGSFCSGSFTTSPA